LQETKGGVATPPFFVSTGAIRSRPQAARSFLTTEAVSEMEPQDATGIWFATLADYVINTGISALLVRLFLSYFFPPDSDRTIWRVVCQVTAPILAVVAPLTPRIAGGRLLLVFAVIWLIAGKAAIAIAINYDRLKAILGG
jgi:uncharacterized protein YggT (Ycf19 family)